MSCLVPLLLGILVVSLILGKSTLVVGFYSLSPVILPFIHTSFVVVFVTP